jgi:hypothetical protein
VAAIVGSGVAGLVRVFAWGGGVRGNVTHVTTRFDSESVGNEFLRRMGVILLRNHLTKTLGNTMLMKKQ